MLVEVNGKKKKKKVTQLVQGRHTFIKLLVFFKLYNFSCLKVNNKNMPFCVFVLFFSIYNNLREKEDCLLITVHT